jgi:hypothetical protein
MTSLNLAARAGRWSAAHWKTAVAVWVAFVAVAIGVGTSVGTHKLSMSEQSTGEAARAEQLLASAGFKTPASEAVLVRSKTRTVADPTFRAMVQGVLAKLRTMPQVTNLRTGAAGEVSKDRRAQLIEFDMKGKLDTADKRVQPLLDAVAGLQKASPGFTVAEFGMASATHELNNTISKDFQNAEKLSVPVTFVILLLAFGAFVAAGVPVLLAFSAVLGSIGLSAIASHVFHASDATSSVILLMGMAVGVDYSLFYLKREREERAAGHEGHEGLFRAAATSGQAVLISGFTVLIAMAGMLFAGTKIFTSIGIGAMLVVFTSLVGSLTVLPALLGKLGDRYIERGVRQVLAATVLRFLRLFKAEPRWLVRMRDTPNTATARKGGSAGVARLGLRDHQVDAPARRRGCALDGAASRAGAAGPEHSHEAAELHRSAKESRDRQDLRHDPGLLPRHRGSSARRRQGQQRDDAAVRQGLRGVQEARARDRRDPPADPRLGQQGQNGRPGRLPARRQRSGRNRDPRAHDSAHAGDPAGAGDAAAGHAGGGHR